MQTVFGVIVALACVAAFGWYCLTHWGRWPWQK